MGKIDLRDTWLLFLCLSEGVIGQDVQPGTAFRNTQSEEDCHVVADDRIMERIHDMLHINRILACAGGSCWVLRDVRRTLSARRVNEQERHT